jgi:hypothetical protein
MKPQKTIFQFICLVLVINLFSACKKEEGEGGKASIYGLVWEKNHYITLNQQYQVREHAATFEDVYIVYGDNVGYGDRIETNFEGKYEFKYLRPGKYKIYVYSKDSLNSEASKYALIKEVEISKKKESLDAGTLTIHTYEY